MTDYFQNSIGAMPVATPGLVVNPGIADISSDFAVETSAGIGPGLVVSRGTDKEKQIVIGGATAAYVLGITCRIDDMYGPGDANAAIWNQYDCAPVMHRGYVWVECTGTGTAGSTAVSYNTTTGAIVLGAPGEGEAALYGVRLWNTVSSGETLALLRLDELRGDPGYVTSITLNGGEAEEMVGGVVDLTVVETITLNGGATPETNTDGDVDLTVVETITLNGGETPETNTDGDVDLTVVEEITLNSGDAETNTDGTVDLTVVESIDVNTSGTPLSGAIDIQDGTSIDVTKADQVVTVAYNAG